MGSDDLFFDWCYYVDRTGHFREWNKIFKYAREIEKLNPGMKMQRFGLPLNNWKHSFFGFWNKERKIYLNFMLDDRTGDIWIRSGWYKAEEPTPCFDDFAFSFDDKTFVYTNKILKCFKQMLVRDQFARKIEV